MTEQTNPTDTTVVMLMATFPDQELAQQCANALLEQRLAACVQLLGSCQSHYRWQGKLEQATEIPLLAKTTKPVVAKAIALVNSLHPYEVPEIIVLPVTDGLPEYLAWVTQATS